MKLTSALAIAIIGILTAGAAASKSLVREFAGSKTTETTEFTVEAPWVLDWRLDGDYEQLVALDITLIESKTGRIVGRVLHTKRKGNGVKLFDEGGVYKLRVSATLARWRVRIEQLTPEEAELYTPRRPETKPF